MKNILVDMQIHPDGLQRLQSLPNVAITRVEPVESVRELPARILRGQHILFCTVPPSNLKDMAALEWIQICSVGYEQLSGLGLPRKGIRACNGRGLYDCAIAEWVIAMMINLARDVPGMFQNQTRQIWDPAARFQAEIRGRVVGLWGYGGIGRQTARLAKVLGLTVHVLSRTGAGSRLNAYMLPNTGDPEGRLPDRVFGPAQKAEFLSGLDFLVLTMPHTKSTQSIVGERELHALPKGAFVLNPARGPLIHEEALLTALHERRIAGAALDAHFQYPLPKSHPLWQFPNVILTPHISGSGENPFRLERVWDIFIGNVERYLADRPLLNELTRAEMDDV